MVLIQNLLAESTQTLMREGNKLYSGGKYNEALSKYEQSLVESPAAVEPKFNKGNSYYRMDDLAKAIEQYKETSAESKDLELAAKAKYNLGNCYFQQGNKEKDSNLQKALEDMKTSITYWRGALDIQPKNEKAAKNIEVARLMIKDIIDQINKQKQQQDPNQQKQQQDPNQQKQQQQNQQQNQQQQQQGAQEPNQSQQQKEKQAGKQQDANEPNKPKEPNQPQQNQKEEQQKYQAPDATAQEILDKEHKDKQERLMQRGGYQKVDKDW